MFAYVYLCLLNHSVTKHVCVCLFSEPKGWPINVTAQELAHDFATLADLLKVTNYSVWIVGPDIIPRPAFLFE